MPRSPQTFTPELMESGRYRYEQTDEFVHLIAQDFGVSRCHFDRLVTRWGWMKRKDRPPRGLPPAQRILKEAKEAVQAEADSALPRPDDVEGGGQTNEGPPDPAAGQGSLAERLERAVEKELAAVEFMRAQYGPMPQPPTDAERTARTLATLTDTLFKVQRLRLPQMQMTGPDDFDDLPADIDEFRHALARRIETFVRSRTGASLSYGGEPSGKAPA